jgi:putative transposase
MARPPRLELANATYHVSSHSDGRDDVYVSDADRRAWLATLGQVCARFNWICHAYCLMANQYEIVIETPEANLSKGMRQLNQVYTQYFNRTHLRTGPVFQGRFKAVLVEKDRYLLPLARDVVMNPLRAKMVRRLENWLWSSYGATAGLTSKPDWLNTDFILSQFGAQRARTMAKYAAFIQDGRNLPSVLNAVQGQIYLGSEKFVAKMRAAIEKKPGLNKTPRTHKRVLSRKLADYARAHERDEAIALAFLSGRHTMAAIADHFGLHLTMVSRLVKVYERQK